MQGTSLVQIREVTPCADERLLQNVLRALIISHNQACHVQHVCPELLSDCAKGVGIALEDKCYQLLWGALGVQFPRCSLLLLFYTHSFFSDHLEPFLHVLTCSSPLHKNEITS